MRFLWFQPSVFAEILVQDSELPVTFVGLITTAIETQIEEFVSLQEISVPTRPLTVNIEVGMLLTTIRVP